MIGKTIGPYEVVAKLGEGGMGEVYRARDTKLKRDVAIKVLPDDVAADAERLKRFEREARTLAALSHAHIAQVYGFEDSGTLRALVMELVPGESLAARAGRGPLPVREALELARQIADGLEAAHDKGIVHRDLKPANVQVTPDEQVKILDFGLAKAVAEDAGHDVSESPTLTAQTGLGVILGTAAYMSPEQARGRPVDARTDIWAFGAVLYECLTGRRAIAGETSTDAIAAILEREPDWTALPAATPPAIRTLLQRCLKKDLRQRLHHIADARFTIEEALAVPGPEGPGLHPIPPSAAPPPRAMWRHPLPLGLALLALALGGALAWSVTRAPAAAAREPQYLSLMLPPGQELVGAFVAISPDGRAIVYQAVAEEGPPGPEGNVPRLYHRRLAEPAPRPLPGTEGGVALSFSPDGKWVGFLSPADRTVKKVALAGGGPTVLAEGVSVSDIGGGRWMADDRIVFGDLNGPLWQVPAAGGAAEVAVPRSALEADELGMVSPVPLKAGFLFSTNATPRPFRIVAWVNGHRRVLAAQGGLPQLAGAGQLLFARRTSATRADLVAAAFDPERAELAGEPVSVLSFEEATAPISYSISPAGTLVYRGSRADSRGVTFAWLVKSDRPAPPSPPPPQTASVRGLRLSPDGRRVLYGVTVGRENRVVAVDLASGTTRIVVSGPGFWATWSHDGRRVIYQEPSGKDGYGLAWRPADGSGAAERLTESRGWQQPQDVTRDGRFLVYQESGGLGAKGPFDQTYDLWLLPLAPRGEPRPLLRTNASEKLPHLSPDGRWMAYVSDETGQDEVWVRAFPDGPSAIRVSDGGGCDPLWAPDGRTLYYRDTVGTRLFAVPATPGAPPQFGTASVTSGHWFAPSAYGRMYDASPDGALLMLTADTLGRELGVVLNFDEVIRRKLAEAKR